MVSIFSQGRLDMSTQHGNIDINNHFKGLSLYELLQADELQSDKQKAEQQAACKQHSGELPAEKQCKSNISEKGWRQCKNSKSEKEEAEKQASEKRYSGTLPADKQCKSNRSEKEETEKQSSEKQYLGKPTSDKQCSNKSRLEKHEPQKKLELLLSHPGNKHCADCGTPEPKWVSMGVGVFICIKCSGVHRSLGAHITKVLSVKLDDWTEDEVDSLEEMGGNILANKTYEARIPEYITKPRPDSSIEERSDFIRRKYETQQFLISSENLMCVLPPPSSSSNSRITSGKNVLPLDKKHNDKQGNSRRSGLGYAFRNSRSNWKRHEHRNTKKHVDSTAAMAGMVEFIGLIKVNVVKGTNLAIRDMVSSDPYVILCLGQQSVKTRVIKNNLNPVWNEQLMLSIPDFMPPLTLLVYDKDTFTTDDFMGQAEINIQPLVSAARAAEKSTKNEATKLGKWEASHENTLVDDSIISLTDGAVKQQMLIRLQNVESGVLEIELECVSLTQ